MQLLCPGLPHVCTCSFIGSTQDEPSHGRYTHLVNGAGDEALDVLVGSKDLGESGAEGWSSLHSGEAHLPDVVTVAKAKDPPTLVHCDTLLNLKHLTVEDWLTAVEVEVGVEGGCVWEWRGEEEVSGKERK